MMTCYQLSKTDKRNNIVFFFFFCVVIGSSRTDLSKAIKCHLPATRRIVYQNNNNNCIIGTPSGGR